MSELQVRAATLSATRRGRAAHRALHGWGALTHTEQRVAALVAEGNTNRSVAAMMIVSPNTVATHVRSIFGKLDVNSRVRLARLFVERTQQTTSATP